jgi:hypothetical protein
MEEVLGIEADISSSMVIVLLENALGGIDCKREFWALAVRGMICASIYERKSDDWAKLRCIVQE